MRVGYQGVGMEREELIVRNIQMPFTSMVAFIEECVTASVRAFLMWVS
jgi:hypothetical protein